MALKAARTPNLKDAEQNELRRRILTKTHGFGQGTGSFQGLDNDIRWRRLRLTTDQVAEMLYARQTGAWMILAPATRKVAEGATNVGHVFTGDMTNMLVLALALHLDPIYVGAHHVARFLVVTFSVAIAARRMAKNAGTAAANTTGR